MRTKTVHLGIKPRPDLGFIAPVLCGAGDHPTNRSIISSQVLGDVTCIQCNLAVATELVANDTLKRLKARFKQSTLRNDRIVDGLSEGISAAKAQAIYALAWWDGAYEALTEAQGLTPTTLDSLADRYVRSEEGAS